jgi:hypothetical protein
MAARDTEQKTAPQETAAPEVAPAEAKPEASKTEFKAEGDLPAVAKTSAVAPVVSASDQAFGPAAPAKAEAQMEAGMYVRPEVYKAACEGAGKPEKWKEHYRNGHTEAKGWTQPYEKYKVYLEWHLQKGTSASKAIQDFIKGPTICDYRTAAVAHDINGVRDELGDKKFDQLFGSANSAEDSLIPSAQRLSISPALYGIPLVDQMRAIAKKADAKDEDKAEAPTPAPVQEARVEEKPKAEAAVEPVVVAQELGLEQADREMV